MTDSPAFTNLTCAGSPFATDASIWFNHSQLGPPCWASLKVTGEPARTTLVPELTNAMVATQMSMRYLMKYAGLPTGAPVMHGVRAFPEKSMTATDSTLDLAAVSKPGSASQGAVPSNVLIKGVGPRERFTSRLK